MIIYTSYNNSAFMSNKGSKVLLYDQHKYLPEGGVYGIWLRWLMILF